MKKLLALVLLAIVLFGGWYFVSPWWAMKELRDAAQGVDVAALEERIDFEAVQDSVKTQMRAHFAERADEPENTSVLAQIGANLTLAAADRAVDTLVTPKGMAAMIVTGSVAAPMIPEDMRTGDITWDVHRESFSRFRAVPTLEDGREGPHLVFARDGLGWDVVAVELSE
jgi:hypothetical protein